jgi:hypothetical protein
MVKKKSKVGSGFKILTMVLISIIITAVVVALVNIGLSIFLSQPEYDDFCDVGVERPILVGEDVDDTLKDEISEEFKQCNAEYEEARDSYNQIRFYVFAVIGLVLLVVGLFVEEIVIRSVGLASGGILILEGAVVNLENKIAVFILLLVILVVVGYLSRRVLRRMG